MAGGPSARAGVNGANETHSAAPQFGAQAVAQSGTQTDAPSFRSGMQALMQSLPRSFPNSSTGQKPLETQASLESQEVSGTGTAQNETQEAFASVSELISGAQTWKPFLQIKTVAQPQIAQPAQGNALVTQKPLTAAKQLVASNSQATITQDETTVENNAASHSHPSTRIGTNSAESNTIKRSAVTQQNVSTIPTAISVSVVPAILPQPVASSQPKASLALNTASNQALPATQSGIADVAHQPAGEFVVQSATQGADGETTTFIAQASSEEFAADFTHATQQAHATSTQTAQATQNGTEPAQKAQPAAGVHASIAASEGNSGNKTESGPKPNASAIPSTVNQTTALKPTAAQEVAAQPQAVEAATLQAHPAQMHVPGIVSGTAAANAGSVAGNVSPAPTAHDTFAALDAGSSQPSTTLVHASARQVEAGYQDPTLGWVSVRADQTPTGVHASILPVTADATQTLSTHMAALNSYLTQHHPGITATITAPQNSGVLTGFTGQEGGQGSSQQGTPGNPAQQQHTGSETGSAQSRAVTFAPRTTSSVESAATARAHNGRISVMA